MMRFLRSHLLLLVCSAVAIGACRADREAIDPPGGEPVDMRPDPRIQEAPALPTPPQGVPIGLEPDTTRGDTLRAPATDPDTVQVTEDPASATTQPNRP